MAPPWVKRYTPEYIVQLYYYIILRLQLHYHSIVYHIIRKSNIPFPFNECRVPRPLRFPISQLRVKYAMRVTINIGINWVSIQSALISVIKSV